MSTARYHHAIIVVSKRILLMGGIGQQNTRLNSVEYYDPNNGESLAVSPMLQPRYGFTAGIARDFIYIMGGTVIGDDGILDRRDTSIERYSIKDDIWTKVIMIFNRNFQKWSNITT